MSVGVRGLRTTTPRNVAFEGMRNGAFLRFTRDRIAGDGRGPPPPHLGQRSGAVTIYWDMTTISASVPSGVTAVADTLTAVPVVLPANMTIDRLAIKMSTAGTAGALARVGIYAPTSTADIYPSALVVDSGAIAVDTTTAQMATVSAALTAGTCYWFAHVFQSVATMPIYQANSFNTSMLLVNTTDLTAKRSLSVAFTYAALPDPYTAGGALGTEVPSTILWRYA